ncbi:MAG: PEP/pyruvate-binding domain-containing protein, partial [Anaerolineae bacterium]|nr:PEP/pyruvate-binding domain-containing protein [Anaerolineae bacterium]
YPRMIGLSHPQLRPLSSAADIVKYSQRLVDVIDLEENSFKTIPLTDILSSDFPGVQYLASVDEGSFVKPIYSLGKRIPPEQLVLTFDNLLKNTDFVKLMKAILKKLERHYERPVDIEFTVEIVPGYPQPDFKIYLLQCRPLSNREWAAEVKIPANIPKPDQFFTANYLVPQGLVEKIKYVVYVDPIRYGQAPDQTTQLELARVVSRINKRLENEVFILMGPGRWGSSNLDLGVKVTYADIYNTRMLIEIAVSQNGVTPEVSHGTHFFQDLVESNIYPLSLYPDREDIVFNQEFLAQAENQLATLLPEDAAFADYIKVIDVPAASNGRFLRVAMSTEEGKAIGYLAQ